MHNHFIAGIVALTMAAAARGTAITSVDLLDVSDGLTLPPAGIACVDVMMDLSSPGFEWVGAGMVARTDNGATLAYRLGPTGLPNLRNPNTGNPPDNRTIFATSIGNPAARDDEYARFSAADVQIAGRYSPTGPPPALTAPDAVNVAWFRTVDGSTGVEGAVARVAITLPAGSTAEQLVLTSGTATPPPLAPIVLVRSIGMATPTGHDAGTVNADTSGATVTGIDWVLSAVPEPATFGLVASAGLVVFRRR